MDFDAPQPAENPTKNSSAPMSAGFKPMMELTFVHMMRNPIIETQETVSSGRTVSWFGDSQRRSRAIKREQV
jgi:hypothetical protein